MTKKHFMAIAKALKASRPAIPAGVPKDASVLQWYTDVDAIAEVCRSFNPDFDRDRFLIACGARRP